MMSPSPNAVSQPPPPPETSAPGPVPVEPAPPSHWIQRADLFLAVMVRLYLGIILVFLPWTHWWVLNRFFLYFAPVAHFVQNGAVRGIVSGLGLLNLWIAVSGAIHYKEY